MGLVYGLYAPNAPNLIAPEVFGNAGRETVAALRALDLRNRFRPDTILVASPHWISRGPFLVQASVRPKQIYDFGGFPRKLSEVRYAPPGDPELARILVEESKRRHLDVEATADWGLDHGAWATLMNLVPEADIPVVALSIAPLPAEEHLAWGEAIGAAAAKSEKRIAFVSTGSITHRLDMFDPSSSAPWPEGERIETEIVELILARRYDDLAKFDPEKWSTVAPEGNLRPLFIMAGALGSAFKPRRMLSERAFGSVTLTTIEFLPE